LTTDPDQNVTPNRGATLRPLRLPLDKNQVILTLRKAVEQIKAKIAIDFEGNARMGSGKLGQNVRKIDGREILRGAEADSAFNVRLQQTRASLIGDVEELSCIVEQDLAVRRQEKVTAIPFKDAFSEAILKLLDL
jgi:Mg2+/Co2+ transporter CorB